ncbi:multifunctional oxoglutarate decarboxylase/oxoglutarate dehydrogenase thiamine pyrophosphate-binding subunit/dihydrolipoyllysine-residue succinyltransferase subunit [Nakamurella aerolata]|uniref:Multifunctional oxoglutarate decarboxylase/oxoglutarate dehydrogenase thiamine pyrophosphate-binding subunit/dihydrolipoyllysine-residue succinyltransferase subunit n=1 Tax=Nakamurella aerolata TaxID=1656892 RepID=A0A849A6M3_9ACTN|nr:multifunctional oxoglutarate decarboxylase/oxoglutarate dehydrogenase thiamine pyrophosphate-binding subunit/dihydrolipoyllysine-residue succinyltransferase subunit [Nakamurella aerolata]
MSAPSSSASTASPGSGEASRSEAANPVDGPEFGPNDWFVQEKYQQYLADPNSVEDSWREYFGQHGQSGGAAAAGPAKSAAGSGKAPAEATAADPTRTGAAQPGGTSAQPNSSGNGAAGARSSVHVPPPPPPPPNRGSAGQGKSGTGKTDAGTPGSAAKTAAPARSTAKPGDVTPASAPSAGKAPASPASKTAAGTKAEGASSSGASSSGASSTAKPATGTGAATKDGKAGSKDSAELAKAEDVSSPIRGAAAAVARNMTSSLEIPTATSVRAVPAKLISDNRIVINNFLKRIRQGKISFTHLIGYAIVKATADYPNMNRHYAEADGKPQVVTPAHLNLGLAIDLPGKNGQRSLVVVPIKGAETMSFVEFWKAYEDVVRKARKGELTAEDYAGTTMSLTNPGGIGTVHSVPRLMQGQGAIIGVGAMEYPAEFAGASERTLADLGISKIMTLTSTYDHRIIQGAESGEFLKRIHGLLLGEDGFYDEVFASLHIPYEPVRWVQDIRNGHGGDVDKTARVLELIDAYRTRGHLMADTDPLNYRQRKHPDLDVINHGLTLWDLEREFPVGGFHGQQYMKLRDVLGVLRDAYCRTVGVEYMHIQDPVQRKWIQDRVEGGRPNPSLDESKHIMNRLNAAEAFETFLQTKYIGQKRFSLEGGETVIPMLDAVLSLGAEENLDEIVVGMAHRGRLNVLANIVGKPLSQVFSEFEGNLNPGQAHGSGDVKYHLGAEGKFVDPLGAGDVKISLVANPSHLEVVDPVLEGVVRAKQDLLDKGDDGFTVMPLAIHGDAAFAGQGVVAETLNLSLLRGYRTGGTVHVIINNQVGFTTAPEASRSSEYSTDVAKMIQAPIFHVNGDDPEAAVWAAQLAVEYRQKFRQDAVIDLICYRRRGHNENDDPSMTNPLMYQIIDGKRSVRKIYTDALVARGDVSDADVQEMVKDFHQQLERVFNEVRELEKSAAAASPTIESEQPIPAKVDTAISRATIERIGESMVEFPQGFTPHPRVKTVMEHRLKMAKEGNIDWAFGELLAFGSIAMDGRRVRLSGQDSRRGTFVQRHSYLIDRNDGEEYVPLQHLSPDQGKFQVYDSALTEYAGLGFEYGYSVANRDALVMWEAQFGDFANGAQSVIDEYLSSGEAKWGQQSGVVLLLPHGHEGQGPDHSSARIERYLQLCAEGSMTVAQPSTPASYFHLLRRHVLDGVHRPMVVFTPKSMLRNKAAVSSVDDFTSGKFESVLGDITVDPAAVRRVLLTSGKLYYELDAYRRKQDITDTAIIRLEQLYPVPRSKLAKVLEPYAGVDDIRWVQEEPANQGAWTFLALALPEMMPELRSLRRVSRRAMAAPSAGSNRVHEVEQAAVITAAFAD